MHSSAFHNRSIQSSLKPCLENGLNNHRSYNNRASSATANGLPQPKVKPGSQPKAQHKSPLLAASRKSRFSSWANLSSSQSKPSNPLFRNLQTAPRRAHSASTSSVNGKSRGVPSRGGSVVDRHADMRLYLQHRQRVNQQTLFSELITNQFLL